MGRTLTASICIKDCDISRSHATLHYDKRCKQWMITDSSLNGVLINGVRIKKDLPHSLEDNDVVSFGVPDNYKYIFTTHQLDQNKNEK